MLLAIDVGNTNTVLGVYEGKNLRSHWRIETTSRRTFDEYGILLLQLFAHAGLDAKKVDAVAVSSVNRCYYCLTAHGAAVRQLSGDPVLGELLVMNYRAADLSVRHRAMLDFSVKLTETPHLVGEEDREGLRRVQYAEPDCDLSRFNTAGGEGTQ